MRALTTAFGDDALRFRTAVRLGAVTLAVAAVASVSCSLLVNKSDVQCESDAQCSEFPGTVCNTSLRVCAHSLSDAGPDSSSVCDLSLPPPNPNVAAAGDYASFVMAVDSLDWGDRLVNDKPEYRSIGYDINGTCATPTNRRPSCKLPAWLPPEPVNVEGERGIDNALGTLIWGQEEVFGARVLTSQSSSEGIKNGAYAPLAIFHVIGYSGFAADDKVEVRWYRALKIDPRSPRTKPAWDGQDKWIVSTQSAIDLAVDAGSTLERDPITIVSSVVDTNAYVNNFRLVAHFSGEIPITFVGTAAILHGAVFVGELKPLGQGAWSIASGIMSTRISGVGMLAFLPGFAANFLGAAMCKNDANYPTLKTLFCSFVDLPLNVPSDPEHDCAALSTQMRFTAKPATIVGVAAPTDERLCPPQDDPSTDSCSVPLR